MVTRKGQDQGSHSAARHQCEARKAGDQVAVMGRNLCKTNDAMMAEKTFQRPGILVIEVQGPERLFGGGDLASTNACRDRH